MIYLNNAATSYPKPQCVIKAVEDVLTRPVCDSGRGMSAKQDVLNTCRQAVAKVLGVGDASRIFFSSGATESFNLLVRGLIGDSGPIVITAAEHNALLRPLYALFPSDRIQVLKPNALGKISAEDIIAAVGNERGIVFVNHCSNVTGIVQELRGLADAAHSAGALFVTDVSQSAGAIELALESACADAAVFTGHKALFGPTGTGGFYLRPGIELRPSKWGGTGNGGRKVFEADEPLRYEVGTQNFCGLAGLKAGVDFVLNIGVDNITHSVLQKTGRIYDALSKMHGVKLYMGYPESGIITFNVENFSPGDLGYILYQIYHIDVRTGFHCAPLLADVMGTPQGTVRISLSYLTTDEDVDYFIQTMREITEESEIEN